MNSKTTSPTLNPDVRPIPWWQKGVFHRKHWFGRIFHSVFSRFLEGREEISESSMFLYKKAVSELNIFGKNAELIDNKKFGNPVMSMDTKKRS